MSLNFIDTSNNNLGVPDGTINTDGIVFKLAEGGAQIDSDFDASYNEAKAAGKLLGAYDFARPDLNGPIDEANAYVDNLNRHGVNNKDTVFVLDWEHTPTNDTNWGKQFADQVYNLTGTRIIFYMNESTANAYDWSNVWHDYALFVAKYADMSPDFNWDMSNAGTLPNVTWPYGYAMWQWTSRGRLDGYAGNLDCSIFYGDANGWKAFAASRPIVTPPAPEPVIVSVPVIEPPVVVVPNPVIDPVIVPVPVVMPIPDPIPVVVPPVVTPVIPVVSPITSPQPILDPIPTPVKENWLIAFLQKVIQFLIGYNFKK